MTARVGSLLDKTATRSKREPKGSPAFLAKIRQCPCVIPGCGKQAEAAHLRMSSAEYGKTNGRVDMWCLPLCPGHHRLDQEAQHNEGEAQWWARWPTIDPLALALRLWNARRDLALMQDICRGKL